MVKNQPKKKEEKKKKKVAKPAKTENDVKMDKAKKRREKRQSRSKASKRRERQTKRKAEGLEGRGKGGGKTTATHTVQGGVVVVAKEKELKQAFNRAAMEYISNKRRAKAAPKTPPAPSSIFLTDAVSLVSPIGYFGDLPVTGPPGKFITIPETLEILAKIEKKTAPKKAAAKPQEEPKEDEKPEGKDKPNETAVARAKKLLEERSSTLPIFELLREQAGAKRDEGVAKITSLLKKHLNDKELPTDGKASKVEKLMGSVASYIVTRLIKGLSSSVGGARMGFTQALTNILAETNLPTDYYLNQVDSFLKVPKSDLSAEQKQTAWGVVFAALALIASGRTLERVHVMTLVEKLTDSSKILAPVRELCAYLLAHLIDTCDPAVTSKAILPKVSERYFDSKITTWSAEGIYLYIKLFCSPKGFVPESLSNVFEHSLADPEKASAMAEALIEGRQSALVFYPRMHLVWDEWVNYLAKGSPRDKLKAAQTVAGRLRAMWSAVIVDKLSKEDDRRYRALSEYLMPKIVDVIIRSPVSQLPDRAVLLADLGRTHPAVTTELLKRCSSNQPTSLTGRDPKEEADGLIKQLFELNSASIKEKLQVNDDDVVAAKPKEDSSDDEGSESAVEGEDEEGEEGEDAEVPDVEGEQEDREGYHRFAFNMRKVILTEMKKLAMTEGILQDHPGVFQTIGQFFLTHSFFSVPEGAVDSDGLMSLDTFNIVLRTECADHLYTLIKHYDSQASGTRTEAAAIRKAASSILPGFIKHYQRLSASVGSQVLYEPTPESEEILKKIGKYVATGAGKCAKPSKGGLVVEVQHRAHIEALLTLQYFTVVVEGGALTASEDILASISSAASDIGKVYTSGQYCAKDLLDTLLAFNLRSPTEAAQHLAAVTNKVSLSIMEHMVADHLKTAGEIEVLMSPLSEESFTVVDDGIDPEGMDVDEDEDEEEEEEEEGEQAEAKTKADRVAIEKQLAHARMRSLQFLQTFLTKTKSSTPYVGAIAGPVARLAELSLPRVSRVKEKHTGWGEKQASALQNASPVLSGCCTVLMMLSKCPLSAAQVKEWCKSYPTLGKEVSGAVEAMSAIYCKDKEKMQEKEGKHLKLLLLKALLTLVGVVHLANGPSVDASMVNIFKVRSLSVQFTEALAGLFERCPSAVGWGVLPALAAVLAEDKGRPFHRKVLFEIAKSAASKWAHLEKLQSNPASHTSTVQHLLNCASTFSASEGTGEDAWRARVVLPPAIQLMVTLAMYLAKIDHPSKASFLDSAKKTIEEYVQNATVIDLDTRAALRKAWQHLNITLDYKELVQIKKRKPEEAKKEAKKKANKKEDESKKRKREEAMAKEAEAEMQAMERKHTAKKRKVESEKEEQKKAKKEKKTKKEKKAKKGE